MVRRPARVLAIVSVHDEEDVIGASLDDLIRQGVGVYVLDHASTDGTRDEVERRLGRGVVGIESFPRPGNQDPDATPDSFALRAVVRRKQELAAELDADWFINHDADEFRESPFAQLDLAQAIGLVDQFGYNAIDFELFDFVLEDGAFERGDPRSSLRRYRPGRSFDRLQIRCWRRPAGSLDLVSSGGHEAVFEDRRVFPIRFLLRHYPLRSRAQAERKLRDREVRFAERERADGWHVQYAGTAGSDEAAIDTWDPDVARVRVCLQSRDLEQERDGSERLRERLEGLVGERAEWRAGLAELARLRADLVEAQSAVRRTATLLERGQAELRQVREALVDAEGRWRELAAHHDQRMAAARQALAEAEARQSLAEARQAEAERAAEAAANALTAIRASLTWRAAAPLRALLDRFGG